MNSYTEYIAAAISRLMKGIATEKEREDIRQWMSEHPDLMPGNDQDEENVFLADTYRKFLQSETTVKEEVWEVVATRISTQQQRRLPQRTYTGIAAAACIIMVIAAGTMWLRKEHPNKKPDENITIASAAIPPARQGAILTLADGSKVQLDSAGGGLLGSQGKVNVVKSGTGELKYLDAGAAAESDSKPVWNTLTTPKGRQFKVYLPDGSKVWLNAESALEYPVAFKGNKREVKLKGEAYFEIAQDKQSPFFVNITNTKAGEELTIRVLGTSFDAMAYSDEAVIQTTLLDGAVRISKAGKSTGIHPGEAASIAWNADENFLVQKVDIEKVMAWKNGMFHYTQTPLPTIMRDISRWYDVDVRYEGVLPDLKFDGSISRNNSLDKMLQILAINQVHFRMEGRTIVVTK